MYLSDVVFIQMVLLLTWTSLQRRTASDSVQWERRPSLIDGKRRSESTLVEFTLSCWASVSVLIFWTIFDTSTFVVRCTS